jgi:phage tail-like protein
MNSTAPVYLQVPGPHLGRDGRWTSAALPRSRAGLVGADALLLPVDAKGAFRLDSRDGSLGRLTLPRGIAVDERLRVYILSGPVPPPVGPPVARCFILIHDPSDPDYDPKQPFQELPGDCRKFYTRTDDDLWRFKDLVALTTDGHNLYVADRGRHRIVVFALDAWVPRDIWTLPPKEELRDVISHNGVVYILTSDTLRLFRTGDPCPRELLRRSPGDQPWERLAVDRCGKVYLLTRSGPVGIPMLRIFDRGLGLEPDPVLDPAEIRDGFEHPAIIAGPDETPGSPLWYVLPKELARTCGREWPSFTDGLPRETDLVRLPPPEKEPARETAFIFNAHGERRSSSEIPQARTRLFARSGTWISNRLDSRVFRCPWDTMTFQFIALPPGCAVEMATLTSDDDLTPGQVLEQPEGAWAKGLTVSGAARLASTRPKDLAPDCLIGDPPGRFLWFRLRFTGDGFSTPVLKSVSLKLPRNSYVEYLPPVFLEDEESRRFLERFLAVFQQEWDALDENVDSLPRLADPRAVDGSQLEFLAKWFGHTFENGWSPDRRREFLTALPAILFAGRKEGEERPGGCRRGTTAALRELLQAVLRATSQSPVLEDYLFVIEGFRDRDYRMLPMPEEEVMGGPPPEEDRTRFAVLAENAAPLWGPGQIGRFQLGESSRLDQEKLTPGDSPELDVFVDHAHRFRVVAPAALVCDTATEDALCRAIAAEKPAHTAYELQLVGSRFRIGVQSTVGIDTILGGLPAARLEPEGGEPMRPRAAPIRNRLGYDTVLSAATPVDESVRLRPGVRLGVEALHL